MISSVSSYSNSLYSSSTYSNYSKKDIEEDEETLEPAIDTNDDDAWDLEELESFATEMSEKVGTTFDAEEIISKYDDDGDGSITDSEKLAIRDDNGFNMPSIKDIQGSMMNGMGPPPKMMGVQGTSSSDTTETSTETAVDSASDDSDLLSLLENDTTYSQDIIDKYDVNGNGKIDAAEEAAIKKDQEAERLEQENLQNSNVLKEAIQAYNNSQYYQNNLNYKSLFDSAVV
jgi:Ca2+-binding EF-hand superfamily protein